MLLLISAIISALYLVYSLVYWTGASTSGSSDAEVIGAGIATMIVLPHLIVVLLATIFNVIALFVRGRWAALTSGILYAVSMLLMPIYFFAVLVQVILCFVAFARMKQQPMPAPRGGRYAASPSYDDEPSSAPAPRGGRYAASPSYDDEPSTASAPRGQRGQYSSRGTRMQPRKNTGRTVLIVVGIVAAVLLVIGVSCSLLGGSDKGKTPAPAAPVKAEVPAAEAPTTDVTTDSAGNQTPAAPANQQEAQAPAPAQGEAAGTVQVGQPFTVSKDQIVVTGVKRTKNFEGKTAVSVMFNWTNNSDETQMPWAKLGIKVFQDGTSLETTVVNSDGVNYDNNMKKARPGSTVKDANASFLLPESTSPLEIEFEPLINFGGVKPVVLKVECPK